MGNVGVAFLAADVVEKSAGVGEVGIEEGSSAAVSCCICRAICLGIFIYRPCYFLRRPRYRIRVFAPRPRIFCDTLFQ